MRPERLYLLDMIEAADAIARFLKGVKASDFMEDELRQSAVLQKLIVIGEACARLPRRFTEQHPQIPWSDVVGFRNIAVHEYFALNWHIVWVTATQEVPLLRAQIVHVLEQLGDDQINFEC
ncbi:HepT-like ribonuclease domain-containing protein [Thermosynechococcus sp. FA-CM-4201]